MFLEPLRAARVGRKSEKINVPTHTSLPGRLVHSEHLSKEGGMGLGEQSPPGH